MGRPRSELSTLLKSLLPENSDGSKNLYFQPPDNTKMRFPCIVYQRDYADVKYANNSPYSNTKRWKVTIIDEDPDSEIPDKVAALPLSTFQRFFVIDQLNHDIYNVYF